MLMAALFAAASAFVDIRPGLAAGVARNRAALRGAVPAAMTAWIIWTVL
jgi:hypothetical protein